jgi:PKD repeat protein
MRLLFLLIVLTVSTPVYAVSLSEVAWMGSASSANHEWIELYNPGDAVVVDGWTLRDGMNLSITLSGTIPAQSYVILERNRSDGGSVVTTPFLSYGGALVNTGATLTLRRADESVVDQIVGGENWQNIGGDNTTKESAQYTSSGWITAVPTPGRANATNGTVPIVATSTPVVRASSQTILKGSTTTARARGASAPLPWELSVAITAPQTVQVNQPVTLKAVATGLGPTHLSSLVYTWNFGDLNTNTGQQTTHVFAYPGTYIVTLHATFAKHEAIATQRITVLPVQFSLARVATGDLQLYNDAPYEAELSGFVLLSDGQSVVFPPRSYLPERGSITIPGSRIGFGGPVTLENQAEIVVARTTDSSNSNSNGSREVAPVVMSAVLPSTVPLVVESSPVPSPTASDTAFRFATEALAAEVSTTSAMSPMVTTTNQLATSALLTSRVISGGESTSSSVPHWTYGLLALLLAGAVAALVLVPPVVRKSE